MKRYCHLCGGQYVEGEFKPQVCKKCGNKSFANRIPVVELLLFNDRGQALISKRAKNPNKGKYDIPGGFVEHEENFESAIIREISEELGLTTDDFTKPIFVESMLYSYPTEYENQHLINVLFAAKLLNNADISPEDDVESIEFVDMSKLDEVNFAINYKSAIKKAHKLLFS